MAINFPEGTQNYPTGIIQVVSASDTARRELTSTLYDWTACQVSITRKATDSKLLILGQYFVLTTEHDWDGYFYSSLDGIIIRGDASGGKARGHWSSGTDNKNYQNYACVEFSAHVLYTPSNSTSSITITPRLDSEGNNNRTYRINKDGWNGNDEQAHTLVSTTTVLEIGAVT